MTSEEKLEIGRRIKLLANNYFGNLKNLSEQLGI